MYSINPLAGLRYQTAQPPTRPQNAAAPLFGAKGRKPTEATSETDDLVARLHEQLNARTLAPLPPDDVDLLWSIITGESGAQQDKTIERALALIRHHIKTTEPAPLLSSDQLTALNILTYQTHRGTQLTAKACLESALEAYQVTLETADDDPTFRIARGVLSTIQSFETHPVKEIGTIAETIGQLDRQRRQAKARTTGQPARGATGPQPAPSPAPRTPWERVTQDLIQTGQRFFPSAPLTERITPDRLEQFVRAVFKTPSSYEMKPRTLKSFLLSYGVELDDWGIKPTPDLTNEDKANLARLVVGYLVYHTPENAPKWEQLTQEINERMGEWYPRTSAIPPSAIKKYYPSLRLEIAPEGMESADEWRVILDAKYGLLGQEPRNPEELGFTDADVDSALHVLIHLIRFPD